MRMVHLMLLDLSTLLRM
ncbi:hypothetical protein Pint_11140 [Pistacia integerrima]|uniref:Uncharacterized protein n=3 Tax=Pistacia TaxID=55512 RepID=A0ACC1A6S0_9ROSI|nr:hypothetical protein Pint_11138 [Pistacia integerrima]KAJ0018860.1 hypothetical protein Pint_11140 [Pistacia integerrima]KAJ0082660.1 hypothetical protein Patl1_11276 [Pistacia atlantica]